MIIKEIGMAEYSTIYEALSAVQRAIEQPRKDASNPMFKHGYVTLDAVVSSLNNAIKKAEAKIFWSNVVKDQIMYTDVWGYGDHLQLAGSSIANDLGNRGTNSAQAEGSALTYARRYSLSMAFGITSDVDDDGNAVQTQQSGAQQHSNGNQGNYSGQSQKRSNGQNKPEISEAEIEAQYDQKFNEIKSRFSKSDEDMYAILGDNYQINNRNDFVARKTNDKLGIVRWLEEMTKQ